MLCLVLTLVNLLAGPVRLDLTLPDSVGRGEDVPITLRLTNRGRKPARIYLQGRPTVFDIIITGAEGRPVWRRLSGAVVTSILQVRVLSPGETLEFTDHWKQQNDRGELVSPGEYQVIGVLPTDPPAELRTGPARIRILP